LLQELPPLPFYLIHAVVHEEMCGFPAGPQQRLRVPISLACQW
ncbi:MAG: cation transporter, partial [Pseudomonas sp. PGPPP3]